MPCGFFTTPPAPEYPEGMTSETKSANSVRLVLPSTIAPAACSRRTSTASCRGLKRASAAAPAVAFMPAARMLSFSSTGMPCSGPCAWSAAIAASASRASSIARPETSRTALIERPDMLSLAILDWNQVTASTTEIDLSRYSARSSAIEPCSRVRSRSFVLIAFLPSVQLSSTSTVSIQVGSTSGSGMARRSFFVYGCCGAANTSAESPDSTITPCCMTTTFSHKARTTDKS